jgi:Flp pilus assembly protein TadD
LRTILKRENYEEAERCYQKAIALDPEDADSWNGLGSVYKAQDRVVETESCFKKAKELSKGF